MRIIADVSLIVDTLRGIGAPVAWAVGINDINKGIEGVRTLLETVVVTEVPLEFAEGTLFAAIVGRKQRDKT